MQKHKLSRLKSCLIVDDNEDYRDAMHYFMQPYGMTCRVARDGVQAWAAIKACPPDLLITDLDMPPPDGLKLLAMCREAGYHFFVIVISGRTDAVDGTRVALQDCCAAVMRKPFSRRALTECILAADAHEHYRHCVHAGRTAAYAP